jgi:hypothetical protein
MTSNNEDGPLETAMARCARDLADALRDYARERRDDDRKRVADLQMQLCATRRVELAHEAGVVHSARDV